MKLYEANRNATIYFQFSYIKHRFFQQDKVASIKYPIKTFYPIDFSYPIYPDDFATRIVECNKRKVDCSSDDIKALKHRTLFHRDGWDDFSVTTSKGRGCRARSRKISATLRPCYRPFSRLSGIPATFIKQRNKLQPPVEAA